MSIGMPSVLTSPTPSQNGEEKSDMETVVKGLTEQAKRVIENAREEAIYFQHNNIGSEHLLLGLLREDNGGAAHVLKGWFGANFEKVRSTIEFIGKPGDEPNLATFEVAPNTKQIIQLAAEEANRLNHPLLTLSISF